MRLALALILLASLSACRREPSPVSYEPIDLIEQFDSATTFQTTRLLNFGFKVARPYMASGWAGRATRLDGGGAGTWSTGDAAEIEFFVARLEDLELTFRWAAKQAGTAELQVNGSPWRVMQLSASLAEYPVELPAALQQLGPNRLSVVHPPRAPGSENDERILWDFLRFGREGPDKRARALVRPALRGLFIPYGTQVDYAIGIPEDSVLAFDDVRVRGSATGRLQVGWTSEDGEDRVLTDDLSTISELRLGSQRGRRLSLFALAKEDPSGTLAAGVVLYAPRIQRAEGPEAAREAAAERPTRATLPNIVVYLVDTLRRDHLGCYGYDRNTSPRIDAFARDAFLFENAQAQSSWTRPSVASLFTGQWPQVHGAVDEADALADDVVTLAETLRGLGYRTAAITANGLVGQMYGFGQGFDYFKEVRLVRPPHPLATSADVEIVVSDWLTEHADDQPFFLYVHTIDPHAPYEPPEPYRQRFAPSVDPAVGSLSVISEFFNGKIEPDPNAAEQLAALYDAEIAANDATFGEFLDELSRRDLYDPSLIVLVSDHGEEFREHGGWSHGQTLHAEQLEIPLLIKLPGGSRGSGAAPKPRRIVGLTGHVDVTPTLLDAIGAEVPADIQGRSLLPLIRGEGGADGEGWADRSIAHLEFQGNAAVSLIDGSWKLIQRVGDRERPPELYDRAGDPHELNDLAALEPDRVRSLTDVLRELEASAGNAFAPSPVDPARVKRMAEELRALGYVE